MAWWIARSNKSLQHILLVLILMPFWTSSLLRMYALIGLLNPNGVINDFLIWAGITVTPIQMMQTDFFNLFRHDSYLFAINDTAVICLSCAAR